MIWLRTKLLQLFSERDNSTIDVVRVTCFLIASVGCWVFFFLSVWDVVVNKTPFGPEHYGAGLGLIIATFSAAVSAKALTEKKP